MGSATRDDLVLTEADASALLAGGVIIEEKVDGANLGISFGSNDGPARCQKRGHWITPHSEQQFAKLESWLLSHQDSLRKVLGTQYILFGEWLAAKHSVPYDALPDWFLAFDVYDKRERKFLSSQRRDQLLRGTGVRSVPSVTWVVPPPPPPPPQPPGARAAAIQDVVRQQQQQQQLGIQDVRRLVLGLRSALCVPMGGSGQWAEGVYVRREEGGWLVARAKVVNPAFRQAIEGPDSDSGGGGGVHWTKRTTQWNRLRPDLWEEPWIEPDEEQPAGAGGVAPGAAAGGGGSDTREEAAGPSAVPSATPPQHDLVAPAPPAPAAAASPSPSPSTPWKAAPGSSTATAATAADASASAPRLRRPAAPSSLPPLTAPSAAAAAPAAGRPQTAAAATGALQAASRVHLAGGGFYVSLGGGAVDGVAQWLLRYRPESVPPGHAANRVSRDGPHHHVTLVTPPEMDELRQTYDMDPHVVISRILDEVDPSGGAWVPLGLGRLTTSPVPASGGPAAAAATAATAATAAAAAEAVFAVVSWPSGHAARAALGLTRQQHFHITLGFNPQDIHGPPKDLSSLVGARLDEQLVAELQGAAESAGARFPRHHRAAVLVWQALHELQPQASSPQPDSSTNVNTSPGTTSTTATSTTSASCSATGPSPSSVPASSPPRPPLTPQKIDCLHSLLGLALRWTAKEEEDEDDGPQVTAAATAATAATTSAAATLTTTTAPPTTTEERVRRLVAACAHVALAQLAGRCGEMEEVVQHAAAADAAILLQPGRNSNSDSDSTDSSSSGHGAAVPTVGCTTAAAAAAAAAAEGVMVGREELGLLAAAAGLAGKALCQLERFGEAAERLEAAAERLEAAGERLEGAGLPELGGTDVLHLLLRAVRPTMDVPEFRSAAGKCARRAQQVRTRGSVVPPAAVNHGSSVPLAAAATEDSSSGLTGPPRPHRREGCSAGQRGRSGPGGKGGEATAGGRAPEEEAAAGGRVCQGGKGGGDQTSGGGARTSGGGDQTHAQATPTLAIPTALLNPRERMVVRGVSVRGSGGGSGGGDSGGSGGRRAAADVTLMRNTSWVVPGVLAGSSTPKSAEQIDALQSLGVGLVVTLTEEEPLPPEWFAAPSQFHTAAAAAAPAAAAAAAAAGGGRAARLERPGPGPGPGPAGGGVVGVRNLFVPVPNYEPPSVRQMDEILAAIEDHVTSSSSLAAAVAATVAAGGGGGDGRRGGGGGGGREGSTPTRPTPPPTTTSMPAAAVLVHCGGGKGRAGTVLACYICKHGLAPPPAGALPPPGAPPPPPRPPALSADEAVRLIRELRPGSIETEQQRRFVGRYCDELWRRYDRAAAAAATATEVEEAAGNATVAAAAGAEEEAAEAAAPGDAPRVAVPVDRAGGGSTSSPALSAAPDNRNDHSPSLRAGQQQQQQQQQQRPGPGPGPAPVAVAPARPQRPVNAHSAHIKPTAGWPRLVFLVGLPGSGKSTFGRALEATGRWGVICQDDCGSRGAAEAAFGAALRWRPHVVLDRCNPDAADRRGWMELGFVGRRDKGVVAVFFDIPKEVCRARVLARKGHPTIEHGRGGRIVDSFAARLQPPSSSEGFERVYVVRDEGDAEALLASWGAAGMMRIDAGGGGDGEGEAQPPAGAEDAGR